MNAGCQRTVEVMPYDNKARKLLTGWRNVSIMKKILQEEESFEWQYTDTGS
jgi:hypothetical protein